MAKRFSRMSLVGFCNHRQGRAVIAPQIRSLWPFGRAQGATGAGFAVFSFELFEVVLEDDHLFDLGVRGNAKQVRIHACVFDRRVDTDAPE